MTRFLGVATAVAVLLGLPIAVPATAAPAVAPAPELRNASCQGCHADGTLHTTSASGDQRALPAIAAAAYEHGVHGQLDCVSCHTEIVDARAGHQKRADVAPPDCAQCHEALWDSARRDNAGAAKQMLGTVAANIAAYRKSFHARPNSDDPARPNASCTDCHNTHSFAIPPRAGAERLAWRVTIPASCGQTCHEEQLEEFNASVHGRQLGAMHNANSAVCSDCHSAHDIGNTSAAPIRLAITAQCGSCHAANYKSYKATYHGQINTLGYANTAKCFDCHGSHGILEVSDPKSKVHPDQRLQTCRSCHNGKKDLPDAPPGFLSFQPHGHAGDFKRYPEIWIAHRAMNHLLAGTFAFFWLHTLLWFYREFKERRQRQHQPQLASAAPDSAGSAQPGRHFQRFSRTWRIAHLSFALSLMLLTLTGMPLFYPEAPWAAALMSALGGPQRAGLIHRVAATVFAGVFIWHLAYLGLRIARDWKNFKVFGPNSLVPGWQDLKDIVAMFRWFVGRAPRPVFDRWTYWEKFDYWAPFWGVTIIGVSGLLMWLPQITARHLPGWVFNVAAIFHGEEAFLAVVFLFTVHFFNNHFRPDKFPLEIVMFTGTVPLDEYRRDHPLDYQRLLDSGDLEKYLVDAPSPTMTTASKALGFTLIVCGLALLTLVGVGFFSGL